MKSNIKTTPVKGTVDYLPAEMELRQSIIDNILATYKRNGFLQVKTPILENLEILTKGDEGDNQKLMFKTIKRGEKLDLTKSPLTESDIVEEGLKYDQTVPLARLFAGNKEKLTYPFKSVQIDESFRAERPQKGRNRQFTQCDVDIWGDSSILAEAEILTTVVEAYASVGLDNLKVKINDRRILSCVIKSCGFAETEVPSVCISLDKLDKIGTDGVQAELLTNGYQAKNIDALMTATKDITESGVKTLSNYGVEEKYINDVSKLVELVNNFAKNGASAYFDFSLIRGQGYYTGIVFEVFDPAFNRAVGGGGRYDLMLERFLGVNVPAVGFGLGLDVCYMLVSEKFGKKASSNRLALVYDKQNTVDEILFAKKELIAKNYDVTTFPYPNNYSAFIDKLKANNYFGLVKIKDIITITNI